ncbi:MAG: DUF1295 domain-containing protein, partial [Woeseiaceae bacterium]|nr:DUF1295 domain-containing protein [Woeseiaceae bacterium]
TEAGLHHVLALGLALAAVPTAAALFMTTAPYGRHLRPGWGPAIDARLGWVVMESPAVVMFLAIYAAGENAWEPAPLVLLALWQFHYVERTFVFPLRLRPAARLPVAIVAMAFGFNTLNAYLNARWISHLGDYAPGWLGSSAFVAGGLLFVTGWLINRRADRALQRLRADGGTGYRVPRGGLFERVSCPNYLGEIIEWCGWAIASWSLAGFAFALFTAANLVPRAVAHHRWYRREFPDYPAGRRALIPWLL